MQKPGMNNFMSASFPERLLFGVITVVSVMIAFSFGALLLGLSVAASLVLGARIWWLRRHLHKPGVSHGAPHEAVVVEGEYRVLDRRTTDRNGGQHV